MHANVCVACGVRHAFHRHRHVFADPPSGGPHARGQDARPSHDSDADLRAHVGAERNTNRNRVARNRAAAHTKVRVTCDRAQAVGRGHQVRPGNRQRRSGEGRAKDTRHQCQPDPERDHRASRSRSIDLGGGVGHRAYIALYRDKPASVRYEVVTARFPRNHASWDCDPVSDLRARGPSLGLLPSARNAARARAAPEARCAAAARGRR